MASSPRREYDMPLYWTPLNITFAPNNTLGNFLFPLWMALPRKCPYGKPGTWLANPGPLRTGSLHGKTSGCSYQLREHKELAPMTWFLPENSFSTKDGLGPGVGKLRPVLAWWLLFSKVLALI